ncbi:MAG: polyphosphate kinase 1 [Gemmatimonadota bacterium]
MISDRVLRFIVPDHEALGRIATAPLPLELHEVGADLDVFRIVYFDTRAGDLTRKRASVRLRIRPDETQLLQVEVDAPAAREDGVLRRHAEADVPSLPAAELFAGTSEPARMLRALVDPAHLKPAFELETVRQVRMAAPAAGGAETIRFSFDAVTVRKGNVSGELHELEVAIKAGEPVGSYDGLVEDIERAYGVHLTLADTVARARRLLDQLMLDRLEQDVRGAREVAVVAYQGGRIALARNGKELRIPTGHGSGQDACRRVLRNVFGKAYARIRLLGTSAGVEARPGLEVWLAEGLTHNDGECDWLPLDDVLERVGSPRLRDARTLAALHTIARSDLAVRAANGGEPTARAPAYPIFARAVSKAKVDAMLEQPESEKVASELLLNPELSRLSFDERILFMAEDEHTPLLERVRFLSMFGQRLDDFFMTRVAEFKQELAAKSTETTPDGLTAGEQLDVVRIRARQVARRAYRLLGDQLLPTLEANGIHVLGWQELGEEDRAHLRQNFTAKVEAVTTPVIADPTHPFPHIRNLRPAIAATLRLPESRDEHFVAIELPSGLPRFVPLPDGRRFVPLEDIILASLPNLYPGLELVQANTFRVTRSGVIELQEEPAGGVLSAIEEEIERRPFGDVVRLEVQSTMPAAVRDRLLRELQYERPDVESNLSVADVHVVDGLVDLAALRELGALEVPALHFPAQEHYSPLEADRPVLDQIREGDVLLRFPEHSFDDTLERFMAEAAEDPDVVAMKITLYRTNPDSRLVRALADARSQGKDAFALVELKASFDERRNIEWARSLQNAGIHVVFSPANIKVHAKIALVVRREEDGLHRYVYIGTGNLNAATARAYTDVGLLSSRPELGEEVSAVFNLLTAYSGDRTFEHLLVSPFTMRPRFLQLIEREIEHAKAGREAYIRAQMNGLADRRLIAALYRASHAGVRIDMAVREICCLRPGVPGLSENIRVVSVLGRFLQHSRIFYFHNAGEPEYFLGSADWRPRNLSKRVEVATPIIEPAHRAVLDEMLEGVLRHPEAWELTGDGTLVRGDDVVAI